jgi:3-oxoacyl-[acyl-carrier-protein] synthase II
MTTLTALEPLLITGCGVASPAGLGLDALAGAVNHGPAEPSTSRYEEAPAPAGQATSSGIPEDAPPILMLAVPDLKVAEHLGTKGIGHLDRTTLLALVACKGALAALTPGLPEADRAMTGVVIGTSTGSIRSSSEFSRDTLVQARPYLVRANLFPNSVMNCCAGQVAIFNGLRGVNATLAGGHLSSLAAFRYAHNAIACGHVERALVGGVEELSAQSAWGWHLTRALTPGTAVGEGCAVFVVESRRSAAQAGRAPLAEILACELGSSGAPDPRHGVSIALTDCIERALRRSGLSAQDIGEVALGAAGQRGLRSLERRAVLTALGALPPQAPLVPVVGETFSASGALQVAALLSRWRRQSGTGAAALVTSVGHDGNVGCLIIRQPVTDI